MAITGFSIFTLIVFFGVNILVVFPFDIPIPFFLSRPIRKTLESLRILNPIPPPPRPIHGKPSSPPPSTPNTETTPNANPTSKLNPNTYTNDTETSNGENATDDVGQPAFSTSHNGKEEQQRWIFHMDLTTAPVIGVLLLLATTSIGGDVLRNGIVGTNGVKPYDIMTLFLSLAYLSLSLDCTGLLRYLAFTVALKGGRSGPRLYLFFYLFFFLFGTLVGNDPIILSGTSFLAYFTRIAGISPPTAWIFAQFASSNVASAVLVSSNPTNLVLTGAFDISFLVFSAWTVLPVLATGIILFPILLWGVFREEGLIPKELDPPDVDPRTALIDPHGAVFGSILLGITLAALVGLSAGGLLTGVEGVWTVTAPAAILMVCRDIWHDAGPRGSGGPKQKGEKDEGEVGEGEGSEDRIRNQGEDDLNGTQGYLESGKRAKMTISDKEETKNGEIPLQDMNPTEKKTKESRPKAIRRRTTSGKTGTASQAAEAVSKPLENGYLQMDEPVSSETTPSSKKVDSEPTSNSSLKDPNNDSNLSSSPSPRHTTLQSTFHSISYRLPTFTSIFTRLPLPLLPFAFSMFILVEALSANGWIDVWAGWWGTYVARTGLAGSIFMMGLLSVVGCNIFGTNIGATILLSSVVQTWNNNTANVDQRVLYGAIYTLAIGSNFGAFSFTFSASLAGLLWKTLLNQKGIQVSRLEFASRQWMTVIISMIIGCLVVAGEVCVIYK